MQDIKVIVSRPLSAGLPYRHIATAQSFSEVPGNLRHRFKYELATMLQGVPLETIIAIDEPTAKLAGKTLALSFRPPTTDDQVILRTFMPSPDPDTGEIDPALLPIRLPGHLIGMTAEITLDGDIIGQGSAGILGDRLKETMGLLDSRNPDAWETSTNYPTAGEYRAIGLHLQQASPAQAVRLKANIENTRAVLKGIALSVG